MTFGTYIIINVMSLNPNALTAQTQGINGVIQTPEGRRAIGPFTFAFVDANPIQNNLAAPMSTGNLISFGLSIYIDNSANPNPVVVNTPSGHAITAKGNTQGWYPIILGRPIIFSVSCAAGAGTTKIMLANYEVPPAQWPTV